MRVALTWDDGPDPESTPVLLDCLAELGVHGTFFCIGQQAREFPDLVRRVVAAGHGLANHGDSHTLTNNFYPRQRMLTDIARCQDTLQELTGVVARYYRPPFGLRNHAVDGVVRSLGLNIVGWQVRSLDTGPKPVADVAQSVLAQLRPGGIVLLHDGGLGAERVAELARAVIVGARARGFEPVTLDELLG